MLRKVREIAARVVKPNRLIVASVFMFIAAATEAIMALSVIMGLNRHWMLLPTIAGGVSTLLWNPRHVAHRLIIAIIFILFAVDLTLQWLFPEIHFLDWFDYFYLAFSPLPFLALGFGFGGYDLLFKIAVIFLWIAPLAAFAGGVSTLISTLKKRRLWNIALAGAISAIICSPVAGLAAIILTAGSRNEFRR